MTSRFQPRLAQRPVDTVLRRFRSFANLSDSELDLLRGLGERRERHAAGEDLVTEGVAGRRARFVVSGWACSQRLLSDGRRQIMSFLLPGDLIGLNERPSTPALCSITAVTALETLDAEPVFEAVQSGQAPGLARAMVMAQLAEQSQFFDQMVRLGRHTAYERVAHLLLELQRRLQVAGLGDTQRFPLPLTQEILADALGLSIVHVNRTLQQLRREKLIELRSGVAILMQPDVLAHIADYRPPLSRARPAAARDPAAASAC